MSPPSYGETQMDVPAGVTQVPLSFISEGHLLEGTLYRPAEQGFFPVVVVLHGASAGRRDSPPYLHLARVMNEIGVAVFLYDRRGEDIPREERVHPGYMALGRDGLAAVRMLRARADVDAAHVGLWGISQGGWIAPAAVVQGAGEIAFLILVSSSGVAPDAQMVHAIPRVLRSLGYDDQVAREGARLREMVHAYYRGEIPRDVAQPQIDRVRDAPWFEHLYIDEQLPERVAGSGWDNESHFDPWSVFSRVNLPVQLFYGEMDPWIPIDESVAVWRKALAEVGNEEVEIHRLPRTGHHMVVDEPAYLDEGSVSDGAFSPDYTRRLQSFVRRVVRGRGRGTGGGDSWRG